LGAGFISNPLNHLANGRAFKAFDRALELNPSDPITLQGKDNAMMALGRNSEANAAFAKAKETLAYSYGVAGREPHHGCKALRAFEF